MIFEQRITRLRAQTRTTRGGDIERDWTLPPDELMLYGVSVQPSSQIEQPTITSDFRQTTYRVLSRPGTDLDVDALDRIVYDGDTFEVDGDVARWPDPFSGLVHHVEFNLTRVVGG